MTYLVQTRKENEIMKIQGTFNEVKNYFQSKGQTVQPSRIVNNGEDVFINNKKMGILLFDGEIEPDYIFKY